MWNSTESNSRTVWTYGWILDTFWIYISLLFSFITCVLSECIACCMSWLPYGVINEMTMKDLPAKYKISPDGPTSTTKTFVRWREWEGRADVSVRYQPDERSPWEWWQAKAKSTATSRATERNRKSGKTSATSSHISASLRPRKLTLGRSLERGGERSRLYITIRGTAEPAAVVRGLP